VWREVRSGDQNYTSIPGREMGVLIQPQARFPGQGVTSTAGEAWRQYRNGPVTVYGGWLVVIVALAIAVFYAIKGPMKLHEKPSGRMIERFNTIERTAHWCMGISFVVLAISGLILLFGKHVLLPVVGYTLFAWLSSLAKNLHNFVGPFFILSVLVFVVLYIKDNLPAAHDIKWFAKGGGMLTGEHVPSGRFNAGEKTFFWGGVVVLTIVMAATGLVLLFPNFEQLRTTMQQMSIIHAIAGIIFIAMSFGHIYMGTVGMEGAYQSMRSGYVDEVWAKEHHELWYNELKSRRPSAAPGGAVPAGAPRAGRDDTGG
jgi:formate dehydrogenase subunit gamma